MDKKKPQIGEVPIYIWKERRIQTIREAMRRYLAEYKIIPTNWLNELKFFPNSTYKDQVDASSGAFAKLTSKKLVKVGLGKS